MEVISDRKKLALVMVLPLLFVLMPRLSIPGGQFITYPLLGLISVVLCVCYFTNLKKNRLLIYLIGMLYIYSISIAISIMMSSNIQLASFSHIFKPLLFVVFLFLGYLVGCKVEYSKIEKGLVRSAKIILISQIVIGLPQLFNITLLNPIYNADLARPIGSLIRIVGTLANPNIFAWIISLSAVIIFLMETRKSKLIWLLIATGLILLSGSRTSFVLFPTILFVCSLLKVKKNAVFYFVKLPFYIGILFISFITMIWLISKYAVNFPYLSQLLDIIETGEITSVSSFNTRTIIWGNAWNVFMEDGKLSTLLFGLGPNYSQLSFVDNDFLYNITNYGFIGFGLNLSIYLFIFIIFSMLKKRNMRVLGQQYVIFSFVIGIQAETISGWNYPILLMFFAGIAIAIRSSIKNSGKAISEID